MVQGKIYKTDIRFFLILYKPLSQMVYGGIFVEILRVGILSAVEQIEMIAAEVFAFSHMVRTFFQANIEIRIYRFYSLLHKFLQQAYPHAAAFQSAAGAAEYASVLGGVRALEQNDAPSVPAVDFDQLVVAVNRRPTYRICAYIQPDSVIFNFFSHKY